MLSLWHILEIADILKDISSKHGYGVFTDNKNCLALLDESLTHHKEERKTIKILFDAGFADSLSSIPYKSGEELKTGIQCVKIFLEQQPFNQISKDCILETIVRAFLIYDEKNDKITIDYLKENKYISPRTHNALMRANILCIGDIRRLSDEIIKKIKNLGQKGIDEINDLEYHFGFYRPKIIQTNEYSDRLDLLSFSIPKVYKDVSDEMFLNCKNLKEIMFHDEIRSIGNKAFENCESLEKLDIPNSVKSIGSSAFSGCKSLSSINLSDQLNSIGSYAFLSCKNLTLIVVPENVSLICDNAFTYCENVKEIRILGPVSKIRKKTFAHCKELQKVYLPDTIEKIDETAFYCCDSLEKVYIGGIEKQKYI